MLPTIKPVKIDRKRKICNALYLKWIMKLVICQCVSPRMKKEL